MVIASGAGVVTPQADGRRLTRDLGERAALEVIRSYPLADNERALMLIDDHDAERLIIADPAKLIPLTTWDYLRQLENAQRIQSADAVMESIRAAGRNPSVRDLWSGRDPKIRDAVQALLAPTRAPKGRAF